MAGVLEGLDIPKWMTPQQWSEDATASQASIGRNVSAAVGHVLSFMGMMQQAQQAKDGLALKTKEFESNQEIDRGKLQLGKDKLDYQRKAQEALTRDQQRLAGEMDAWHSGGPLHAQPEPQYETRSGQAARDKTVGLIEKGTAEHQADLKINKIYGDILGQFPQSRLEFDAAKASSGGAGTPEWNEVYNKWHQKLQEQQAEAKHPMATGPVTAFQLKDESGNVIPNSPWVYHGQNGAVHVVTQKPDPADKEKEAQHKFELSRLGKQIDEANKAVAADPQDEAAKARVAELGRQKDALFGKTKGASAVTGPAVGAVVKGYKFLGGDPANPESWQKQ